VSDASLPSQDDPRPWSDIVAALDQPARDAQRAACDVALARLSHDPSLYASLGELLRKGTPAGRFAAAFVLFRARKPGIALLPALLDSLSLPDGDRRWEAVHMLVLLGRMETQVTMALLHTARSDDDPTRRRMCLFALRELIPESPFTSDVCMRALDDADLGVRRAALSCLVKLRPKTRASLERTLAILRSDQDPKMQLLATAVAVELASEHPDAQAAVRLALESATRGDPHLRRAADLALRRIQNQE